MEDGGILAEDVFALADLLLHFSPERTDAASGLATQTVLWHETCDDGRKYTACGHGIAHRKWKETKPQPGTTGPGNMLGCCLV